MRIRIKTILAVLSALACLAALVGCESRSEPVSTTLMVYMCGSDLESTAGAATRDLEEMAAALPEDGSLQIAVLAAGSLEWSSDIDPEAANIYRLTPQGPEPAQAGPDASMGDPETLAGLLRFGFEQCPADRYALLLWDHGAGPMAGVCFDQRHTSGPGMDSLTLQELRSALENSPFAQTRLSWIGFDACLMASAETAWAVAPYAEYMIASQELEPAEGWCYSFLTDVPRDRSGADTGRRAADAYAEYFRDSLSDITLSCIDLSQMESVTREMTELFGSFRVDRDSYAAFARCRSEARSIGGAVYAYDLVDLADLLEVYEEQGAADCGALRKALGAAVVYNRANGPYRNGLSLYYPFMNKTGYTSPWSSRADELTFSQGYRAFIRQTAAVWLGESLANWAQVSSIRADAANRSRLSLELTEDQLSQYAGARLLVLEEGDAGIFHTVYSTDDVSLRGSTLTCSYAGEALFAMSDDGEVTSGSIYYASHGDDLYVSASLYFPNESRFYGYANSVGGETTDYIIIPAALRYRKTDALEYAFVEATVLRDDGALGKSTLRLEDCLVVEHMDELFIPVFDSGGRLLPYSRWEASGSWWGYAFSQDRLPRTMAFLPLEDGDPRYAMFEITDLQGEVWTSDMISLPNPNRTELTVSPRTVLDCEACSVTLDAAALSLGAEPGLELTFTAVNHSDEEQIVKLKDFMFDNSAVSDAGWISTATIYLDPGQTGRSRVRFDADLFRYTQIRMVDQLSLTAECADGYGSSRHIWGTGRAVIPLDLDAQALLSGTPESAPLDSLEWNGVTVELTAMDVPGNGLGRRQVRRALIHLINPTDEQVNIGWNASAYRINDSPPDGWWATLSADSVRLPAGCDAYVLLSLNGGEDNLLPDRIDTIGFRIFAFDDDLYDRDQRTQIADLTLRTGN